MKPVHCHKCGRLLTASAPFGHCPRCLLGAACGPAPDIELKAAYPPALFADYELLEKIGQGGMGVVYKARQSSLNRVVALKMLNPRGASVPELADRLRREAEALASLQHPGIVTIYEIGAQEGQPFFTMEFIDGQSLDKLIGETGYRSKAGLESGDRREPQATIVRILIAISEAVDHAHKRGVLHRDLKPANVVLDTAGQPHLTDFGLAKVLNPDMDSDSESGSVMGTPAYMGPEQAAGETGRMTTAADIYSLGAIFYDMLTGRPPFRGNTPLHTLRQVQDEPPKPPHVRNESVDLDLSVICLKCLEKEPEQRYPTAKALADELKRWLQYEPILARPTGPLGRLQRWCRREPLQALMALGLVCLLATCMLLIYEKAQKEKRDQENKRLMSEQRLESLSQRIEQDWQAHGKVRIAAPELALLDGRPHRTEGNEHPVVLAVHSVSVDSNPVRIVDRVKPLLQSLKTTNVLFELRLFNTYSSALEAFESGQVGVMLLSPESYVELSETHAIQPLAAQSVDGRTRLSMVIFTSTNSPIQGIDQLNGHSLVTGINGYPGTETWLKAELSSMGLRLSALTTFTNRPRSQVVTLVNAGTFDVGVLPAFQLFPHKPRLRTLHQFEVPAFIWAGSSNLSSNVAGALRGQFQAIRDAGMLSRLEPGLTGFMQLDTNALKDVKEMQQKARAFDRGQ